MSSSSFICTVLGEEVLGLPPDCEVPLVFGTGGGPWNLGSTPAALGESIGCISNWVSIPKYVSTKFALFLSFSSFCYQKIYNSLVQSESCLYVGSRRSTGRRVLRSYTLRRAKDNELHLEPQMDYGFTTS